MGNLSTRALVLSLAWLALAFSGVVAQKPTPGTTNTQDDVAALAARIDQLVEAGYKANKAQPAPVADDAEFLRRAYLDVAGRIPRVSEVRAFLADKNPNKRRVLIDNLLAGPHYVNHFSDVWRTRLLPQTNDRRLRFYMSQMETWIRQRLVEETPYDQMVRDLITAPIVNARAGGRVMVATQGPRAFYQANQYQPEELAAATSRLFLGVKLECAQCHDHPFAEWKRKQFWQLAAFYSGIRTRRVGNAFYQPTQEVANSREITIPGSERKVQARFLTGKEPKWSDQKSTRETLADWITHKDNPYFARAAVNWMWEHFFGTGLVEPVDEMNSDNKPSHPELLDTLAREFVAHKFQTRFLIRAITTSKTYQRTSRLTHASQKDPHLFARMAVKGLTAEQLFDSLALATGYKETSTARGRASVGTTGARAEFLTRFGDSVNKRTERQTSILQALALMNGKFVADATSLDKSETLAAVLDSPFMDNKQRLETLYLAALSRPMHSAEEKRLLAYVQRGGPTGDSRKALADVFWVLLNSSEFIVNH